MTKRKTKTAKRKPKAKPIGVHMKFNGYAYSVQVADTFQDGKFEWVKLTAVRHLPLSPAHE
jgi:hypothetical protein